MGTVANGIRCGRWTSDADVAVAHAGPEDGHRALSVPLVDVHDVAEEAHRNGILDRRQADALLAAARETFYPGRTWTRLLTGLPGPAAARLRDETLARPGLKERDARRAIELLPALLAEPVRADLDPRGVLPTRQLEAIRATAPALGTEADPGILEQRDDWPDLLRGGLIRALIARDAIGGLPSPAPRDALAATAEQLGIPAESAGETLADAWGTSIAHVTRLAVEQQRLGALWERWGAQARAHVIDHLRITGRLDGSGGAPAQTRPDTQRTETQP